MPNKTEQEIREQLKLLAISKFGKNISPIGGDSSFDNCYSCFDDSLAFWFNTPDQSSHIVLSKDIPTQKG
jgi:hypothetical protein